MENMSDYAGTQVNIRRICSPGTRIVYAAKESSDRHNRDLSQSHRVAHEAAESVRQGTKRRLAKEKVARPESLSE
jgi:hypothetical protein